MHDECNPSACANTLRSALDGSRLILLFKGDIADPRILSWRTEAVDLELLIACMCPYGLEIDIVAKMYSASPFISHPPEALSQHVSQFRGACRTGVHFLRKNMWAPDRPLLYLRGKRAKYISSAIQLIFNTGGHLRGGHLLHSNAHRDEPSRLADCRCGARHYRVCGHVSRAWTFSFSIPCCKHPFYS